MIVGFSRYGKGDGDGVVGYITDGCEAVGYVVGSNKSGRVRDPAPVVIRGDPRTARHLIDLVPHRWKYTSGILSFGTGERITPETERRVMDEFERCAFAGLNRNRFYTLWVRHQDGPGGCQHLHVVTPRMDLLTSKSLNIAPPGRASRELFDTFRSKMNVELGLSDPDDPTRIRTVRLPQHIAKLRARERSNAGVAMDDPRVAITQHLEESAREGLINSREDVVRFLEEAGFGIAREGSGYLTIQDPETEQRIRLRGGLYDRERCGEALSHIRGEKRQATLVSPERLKSLEEKLEVLVAARARHNRERYGHELEVGETKEESHDRLRAALGDRRSGNGAFVWRTGEETERALGCLDQASQRLERAGRSLVSSSGVLERDIEQARVEQRERELHDRLIQRYGGMLPVRSFSMDRGFERELEMELV